jgi:hypothetical protein
MTKHGDTIVMTVEELNDFQEGLIIITVEKLKEDLNLNYWEELLTPKQVAEDWKRSVKVVRQCTDRKITPLVFTCGTISRRSARDWKEKYYNDYKSAKS